jgi:hypothetical protein
LGAIFIVICGLFLARPIVSKTGGYDILTELILRCKPSEELETLRQDTADFYASKETVPQEATKDIDPNDSILQDDVENGKIFPAESIDHDDVYVEGATKSLLGNDTTVDGKDTTEDEAYS